ncbi:hypothetical protein GA0116948_109169 [Chitinophaga costaii]|uniref:Uncharacterized protein n=1 Tax=Chitinophaga costaii TaxID=1335309 RepID=A0A1C4ESH6_9BACT|nr:hypothetical protein [Chitinophaga costaii]PUZ22568.1 hypothetical protein DCM91_14980 [Chitinophaga costaii]SCC46618.1 hypothetical protein GA0116948_109169 [Chitinophaga costaii]
MSDHSISIVPKISSYPEKIFKAQTILTWLVSENIVKPELSDCVLSIDSGYAVSEGARLITAYPDQLPFDLITNGLEVITERRVFYTGENGMEECICPHCKENIAQENWRFLNNWYKQLSDELICPLCNVGTEIHQFRFEPEWGFSDLGFTFWNWPLLKESFIASFKEKLGSDISIVYTHI